MNVVGDFIALTLSSLTPILIAAIGGMFAERTRATNIALEGCMVISALAAVFVSYVTGTAWAGLIAAIIAGTLYSLLLALAAYGLQCDLIIAGIAINLLATGLAYLIVQNVLDSPGTYAPSGLDLLPRLDGSFLASIPVIGPALARQSVLVYIVIALTVVAVIVLNKTSFGVRVKAVGDSEEAAVAVGIRPVLVRTTAIAISGAASGIAGAYLSISSVGAFSPTLTGGLGFIAFAAFIFGRATPSGTILASVLFAVFSAAAIFLQGTGAIDRQLLSAMPYAATIAALAFESIRRNRRDRFDVVETSYLPAIVPRG